MDLFPGLPAHMGLECLVRVPYQDFSPLSSVCRSWKHQIELPEFWRHRRASGFARRVVVLAQARVDPTRKSAPRKNAPALVYRLTACEPETGYWAELPPVPTYSDGLPLFCQLVGIGSSLLVLGGLDPANWAASNAVFVYSFVDGTWRRGADMPGARRLFFACAATTASNSDSRTVFVAGGHDGEKRALKSAMAYDVARDVWAHMPDMETERDEPKGVCLRGKFHVVGGYPTSAQGRFSASVESFDANTWQWDPVEEGFLGAAACPRNCAATADSDGELIVAGDAGVVVREGSTWRAVAELPPGVRNAAHVAAWPGKVLVIGSERIDGAHKAYVLDLKQPKWGRVEAEEEFSGHVQSGCCLEL